MKATVFVSVLVAAMVLSCSAQYSWQGLGVGLGYGAPYPGYIGAPFAPGTLGGFAPAYYGYGVAGGLGYGYGLGGLGYGGLGYGGFGLWPRKRAAQSKADDKVEFNAADKQAQ